MTTPSAAPVHYIANRPDWLAKRVEAPLEPDLPIVDPHHHLWDRPGWRYLIDDLIADTSQGHNIVATVFVQCRAMHRSDGPVELRPVGETEFVNGIRAMSASGGYGKTKVNAGIVGHADMLLGDRVARVLEAHVAAGGGHFRGIRHITAWDEDPEIMNPAYQPPKSVMLERTFQAGVATLGRMGLSFDAWHYHPQIDELTAMATAVPGTQIVLDHVGGPLAIGRFEGRHAEVFPVWAKSIRELAKRPNVAVKLGGLGMRVNGFGFDAAPEPPSSQMLAAAWKPYFETCIEAFGAGRCMFESNFPVDKGSYSYGVFWNACKQIAKGVSAAEKASLFAGTADRVYRLGQGIGT